MQRCRVCATLVGDGVATCPVCDNDQFESVVGYVGCYYGGKRLTTVRAGEKWAATRDWVKTHLSTAFKVEDPDGNPVHKYLPGDAELLRLEWSGGTPMLRAGRAPGAKNHFVVHGRPLAPDGVVIPPDGVVVGLWSVARSAVVFELEFRPESS